MTTTMRSAKSNPQLNQNNYHRNNNQQQHSPNNSMSNNNWPNTNHQQQLQQQQQQVSKPVAGGPTSPICRCRVMYLGSSVPLITKDGLQGIQEPLRKLYPMDKVNGSSDAASTAAATGLGIDSWLSVWSNGILIENVDENGREVKRFFKIGALHYCAAVKYIPPTVTTAAASQMYSTLPNHPSAIMQQPQQHQNLPRFLPLDSPYARSQLADSSPPIFASILRRTTGIKVLECHAFICKREAAANALVRCCFHAYADTMYAKQIGADVNSLANEDSNAGDQSGTSFQETEHDFESTHADHNHQQDHAHQSNGNGTGSDSSGARLVARSRSKSIAALNAAAASDQSQSDYRLTNNGYGGDPGYCSLANEQQHQPDAYSMNGRKSSAHEQFHQDSGVDWNGNNLLNNKRHLQKHLSKSMHYLNYAPLPPPPLPLPNHHAAAAMMLNGCGDAYSMMPRQHDNPIFWANNSKQSPSSQQQQPFYNNPYASRVPNYPPPPPSQSMAGDQMDSVNGGGTLKSIRSMAANSIASTLLRSKRHAKSMAQLNKDKIISFHQPQAHHLSSQAHTMMVPPVMLPPIPPMFLPHNLNGHPATIINGSQTMKLPSRSMVHQHQAAMMLGQPMNFETMTPKEMKKLLKKSAKYGLPAPPPPPQANFIPHPDNGLHPLHLQPPPLMPRQSSLNNHGSDGTLPLRPPSIYSTDMYTNGHVNGGGGGSGYADITPDMAALSLNGLPPPPHMGDSHQQMAPILVKPNQEFLKSKAGRKWLKQQKEFKKLLPPHLDGLPIIFGPPPPDALEPHNGPAPPMVQTPISRNNNNNHSGCDSSSSIDQRHRIYY